MSALTDSLRRIIGLWDSLDAVGEDEPAEPYKEQMDAAVNDARKVLEAAYREAAADPDYRRDMLDLNRSSITGIYCAGSVTLPVTAPQPPVATPPTATPLRSCNRHKDCDAADKRAREKGRTYADHCHDDCCEDCFGY